MIASPSSPVRPRLVLVPLLLLSAACSNDEPPPTTHAEGPTPVGSGSVAGTAGDDDRDAPEVRPIDRWRALGWGRLALEWAAASDDATPTHEIDYRLVGEPATAVVLGPTPSASAPVTVEAGRGTIRAEVTTPVEDVAWTLIATDSAGHEARTPVPQLVATRPPVEDVLGGGLAWPLVGCRRDGDGTLTCVGEGGRWTTWSEGAWNEHRLVHGAPAALADMPEGLGVHTIVGRTQLSADGLALDLTDAFAEPPVYPLRRFAVEPSGLALWLDGAGALWGSDGSPFQRFEDPLLLGPDRACRALRDVAVVGGRAMAWCEDGEIYLLRPEARGYQWTALQESEGLPRELRPRQLLFGEGRQITVLSWGGDVWRYDLGGWRLLYGADSGAPATALSQAPDAREVWVGAGPRVWAVDSLGQREAVADIETRASLVYLESGEGDGLGVTAAGDVVALPTATPVRERPPTRFERIVRREGEDPDLLAADSPPARLHVEEDGATWTLEAVPGWPSGAVVNGAVVTGAGTTLLAVDTGADGGAIVALAPGHSPVTLPFLVPVPVESEPAPEGTEPAPLPPAQRLVGELPDRRRSAPPPAPPVRDVDVDTATGTGVAVGEGGSLWLRVENGWLPLDVGLQTPVPFLTVRVTGDHTYLVGAVDGIVLSCEWDACEARLAPVGNVEDLRRTPAGWLAVGPEGVALLGPDGEWSPVFASPEAPYPSGGPPAHWVSVDRGAETGWWLGDDGSLWHESDGSLVAMALLEEPLDVRTEADGAALVRTRRGIFRVRLPEPL